MITINLKYIAIGLTLIINLVCFVFVVVGIQSWLKEKKRAQGVDLTTVLSTCFFILASLTVSICHLNYFEIIKLVWK